MSEPSEIEVLTAALIAERLDPAKARVFAALVVRKATSYKPTAVAPHVLRRDMLAIADALDAAVAAIGIARDESRHFHSASYLGAYAVNRPSKGIKLGGSSGLWDHALKKVWPDIEKTPPVEALQAYLKTYAETARSLASTIPAPERGQPPDFERFRPVLLCAGAYMQAFGRKPGKSKDGPFVRACRCALPFFGVRVPKVLDEHVANALRGIDLTKIRP